MCSTPSPPNPQNDDIEIVYHPHSGKPDGIFHLEDYNSNFSQPTNIPTDKNPWRPFQTWTDFEIAELVLTTHMFRTQIKPQIFSSFFTDPNCFTIANKKELDNTWEGAQSYHASGVSTHIPFKFPAFKLL
jgi:hypothetical protein